MLVLVGMWIFTAICWWKIFEKKKIKGWKAIVPYYGDYVRFDMVGKKWLYFPFFVISMIQMVVSFIYSTLSELTLQDEYYQLDLQSDLNHLYYTFLVCMGLSLCINIYIASRIAARFGKGYWFGVGLGILPIVFAPILAWGKAK